MDKIIPISVAVIILAVSALIVVKEVNKRSDPVVTAQTAPQPLKKSSTPFKPTNQTDYTVQQESPTKPSKQLTKDSSDMDQQAEEQYEDRYSEDYQDFSSQVDEATLEAYRDYVTNNLEENIALTHRFTQESEQWNTIVDTALNTLARSTLNGDLSEYQLTRLRSGINQFLNTRIMDVIQNPDKVPQTPAQMQQFGQEAKEEVDYLLQSELGITVDDLIKNMDPELINQMMSQYEEKASNLN